MNRRHFLGAMAATASGLLVPEWLLDPPKGRSMVAVPGYIPLCDPDDPVQILREGEIGDLYAVYAQGIKLQPGSYKLSYFVDFGAGLGRYEHEFAIRRNEEVAVCLSQGPPYYRLGGLQLCPARERSSATPPVLIPDLYTG